MRRGTRGTVYVPRSSLLGGQISALARSCVKDCEVKDELNHTLSSPAALAPPQLETGAAALDRTSAAA
eukprot:1253153-Rhodomonas_salina.1